MKLLFFIALISLVACSSPDLQKIEARQNRLEGKIDSLEAIIKIHEDDIMLLDSLISESLHPKPGTLLWELEQEQAK